MEQVKEEDLGERTDWTRFTWKNGHETEVIVNSSGSDSGGGGSNINT